MREIKFRIWMGNAFYYWGFLKDETNLYFQGIPSQNEPMSYKLEHSQQYTGFHDKNGKEIYEGDILATDSWGGEENIISAVIWHFTGWAVIPRLETTPYGFAKSDFLKSKVIGNVYESIKEE